MSTKYQLILQQQRKSILTYLILCAVVLSGTVSLGYFKYLEYEKIADAVVLNANDLDVLKKQVADEKAVFQNKKVDYDKLTETVDDSLKSVFPTGDDYIRLTKAFDDLEISLNRAKDPFVISNIDYQDIQTSADGTYRYLPLRMNITTSNNNFTKFMQYIEESGALSEGIRLMDLQSINLNLVEGAPDEGEVNTITFSIKLNAYFQGTK